MSSDSPNQTNLDKDRIILEELRLEYERELKSRERNENKATFVIITSGTIITLLLGFIALFFERIKSSPEQTSFPIDAFLLTNPLGLLLIISMAGIIAGIIIAVVLSMVSMKLGKNLALVSTLGFFLLHNGQLNRLGIERFRNDSDHNIMQYYIEHYTTTIKFNAEIGLKKAKYIIAAQRFLMGSIILIALTLVILLFYFFS